MEWTSGLITEFLDLYEKEPSIWNPNDPQYKDRNHLQESWQKISDNLSVKLPITELKRKRDSLMSTYRKLSTKVRRSQKSESDIDEVFKPYWFAYEKMETFLHGICQQRIRISSKVNIIYLGIHKIHITFITF